MRARNKDGSIKLQIMPRTNEKIKFAIGQLEALSINRCAECEASYVVALKIEELKKQLK